MRFAIDILHPAHVHFFRNFIGEMTGRGHEFLVTVREKEFTGELLDGYGIEHVSISRQARGSLGLAKELALRTWKFRGLAKRFGADFLLGIMGPTIALAGKTLSSKTVVFYDTEMATVTNWFAYPLADAVVTPTCYSGKVGGNHVTYSGYHELAYLHPDRFTPDRRVLADAGLDGELPIYVVRFVSWEASHDIGEKGFSIAQKRRLIELLSTRGQVLLTSEGPLPEGLESYRSRVPIGDIHHALACADLLVGESATMASEAAVLGTHALFVSKTGRGYTDEQERDYGLVHNFSDAEAEKALAEVETLLALGDLKGDASRRRERLLADKIDVTGWMVDYFERDARSPQRS
ncbi:MAG: DUF354 domain-containing protein [Thermoanaerobaculia bacterium]